MIQSKISPIASSLLPAVIEAVTEAGNLIRKEFHRCGGPRGEGGHAPIDQEVEEMLKRRLRKLYPCAWLGEETAAVKGTSDDTWVVDPQDGTRDFLAGRRGSAVSIALLRGGKPVLGVVYAPVAPDDRGDMFAWAEGKALMRNGVSVSQPVRRGRPVVALNADAPDYALHNHRALSGLRVRALPSPAYRLALAAAGEVDAAVSLVCGLAPWDFAGGHALLLGAGGVLVDRDGRTVDYRSDGIDGCIGGPAELVARIVAMNQRLCGPLRTIMPVTGPELNWCAGG